MKIVFDLLDDADQPIGDKRVIDIDLSIHELQGCSVDEATVAVFESPEMERFRQSYANADFVRKRFKKAQRLIGHYAELKFQEWAKDKK